MAIELKEKEKNLLIQSFEYGDSIERDDITQSIVAQGQNVRRLIPFKYHLYRFHINNLLLSSIFCCI